MKKINRIKIYSLIILGFILILINSCNKNDSNNVPALITTSIGNIDETTAISGGKIISDGGATITARGVCWSIKQTPTIADNKTADSLGKGSFTSTITGLSPNVAYYVRAYATNIAGTGYGSAISFTTVGALPVLTTTAISNITGTTATSGGYITSDGGETITKRGVCLSTGQAPTIYNSKTLDGTGTGNFTSNLAGLSANTIYFVRAYATNSKGTGYGSTLSFTTLNIVIDIDGHVYDTVTIGTQVWITENLKVIHYCNGDPIPNITDDQQWNHLTTGAYCDYDNTPGSSLTYGKLYNFYAVIDSRKLCPTGWHVPSDADWSILTAYLGGESVAGDKLKACCMNGWYGPNTANNETGFTALGGGFRCDYCTYNEFNDIDWNGYWWSSTWYKYRSMNWHGSGVSNGSESPGKGFSVRCLKD